MVTCYIQIGDKSKGSTLRMFFQYITGYKKHGVICRVHLLSVFWKLINPFHSLRAAETCSTPVRVDGRKGCSATQIHVYHFSGTDCVAISSRRDRNPPQGSRGKLYHFMLPQSILAVSNLSWTICK